MNIPLLRRLALSSFCVLAAITPQAFSQTWTGGDTDSNWTNAANWTSLPLNNGTANILFGTSPRLDPNVDVAQSINRMEFSVGANAYVISGANLTLAANSQSATTAALVNLSSVKQTIAANIIANGALTSIFANGGDFELSGNISLTTRRLLLFNAGTATSGTPRDITLSGVISGTGTGGNSIVVNDAFKGVATFSGVNTYTGSTQIRNGTIVVKGTQALGAASSQIEFGFPAVAFTGTPSLLANGSGTQVQNNIKIFNLLTGPITVGGNSADVSNYSGNVTLGDTAGKGVTLTAVAGGEVRFNGNLLTSTTGSDNTDTVTKTGAGTVVLSGAANTYSGATAVNAGTLLVNGSYSVAGQDFTVAASAALGGNGTINRAVTMNSSSTLIGGNGTLANGALTISGNLTLNDNTTIQLVLGGGGTHSSLARTGGSWVFDSNQAFSLTGGAAGEYLGIITGLTGSETGLGSIASWQITSAGYVGTFVYDGGGNVNLNLSQVPVPEPASWALLGLGLLVLAGRKRVLSCRR